MKFVPNNFIVSICSVVLLSACGMFSDHSRDYQRAASIKPIVLPEGVPGQVFEPLYPIPKIAEQEVNLADLGNGTAPRPDPLSKNLEEAKVKIQKVGNDRWILAEAPSGQIWPLTQSFLAEFGFSLAKTQAAVGLIETNWLEFKDEAGQLHRFTIRIEQGVHADTTEVHVLEQQIAKTVAPGNLAWPSESSNATREAWLIDNLANSLALGITNRSASLLGQTVGGDIKSGLTLYEGEPVLRLRLPLDRAKASLNRALEAEGFVKWGQSENGLVYLEGYADQESPPGWFARTILRRKAHAPNKAEVPWDVAIKHLDPAAASAFEGIPEAAFGEANKNAEGYWVRVLTHGNEQFVLIRTIRGLPLAPLEAKARLSVLRRNLM
ncbi:MAG TPA: outer membrane protein assembly factor BamC [Cellvibrionaceae bacterium]